MNGYTFSITPDGWVNPYRVTLFAFTEDEAMSRLLTLYYHMGRFTVLTPAGHVNGGNVDGFGWDRRRKAAPKPPTRGGLRTMAVCHRTGEEVAS